MYCDDIEVDYKYDDLTYDAILNLIRGRYPPNVSILNLFIQLYSSLKAKNLKQTKIQKFSYFSMVMEATISLKFKTQKFFRLRTSQKSIKN